MDESVTDGRRVKGQRRRRALVDATIRVIGRSGVAGVSQRVVAVEAGVPASAVPYYFATVDDLLLAALVDVNDDYIAAVTRCAADPEPLAALSALVARAGEGPVRSSTTAEFELFLLTRRGGPWQHQYERWSDALARFFAPWVTGPERAAAASAVVDGLFLRCYCRPGTLDAAAVRGILGTTLGEPDHPRAMSENRL